MEIVSIAVNIKIDALAVSAGSGPSEMSLESLVISIIVLLETCFLKLSTKRIRIKDRPGSSTAGQPAGVAAGWKGKLSVGSAARKTWRSWERSRKIEKAELAG